MRQIVAAASTAVAVAVTACGGDDCMELVKFQGRYSGLNTVTMGGNSRTDNTYIEFNFDSKLCKLMWKVDSGCQSATLNKLSASSFSWNSVCKNTHPDGYTISMDGQNQVYFGPGDPSQSASVQGSGTYRCAGSCSGPNTATFTLSFVGSRR